MTLVLLTASGFVFTLILVTLVLQLALELPGWRQRRDAERRNHR